MTCARQPEKVQQISWRRFVGLSVGLGPGVWHAHCFNYE